MPMPRCPVKFCPYFKRRPNEDNTGVMCHLFPKNVAQRKAWENWVKSVNNNPAYTAAEYAGLCSAHFTADCYLPNQKKLRDDATPSIAPRIDEEIVTTGFLPTKDTFSNIQYFCSGKSQTERKYYLQSYGLPQTFGHSSKEVPGHQIDSGAVEVFTDGQITLDSTNGQTTLDNSTNGQIILHCTSTGEVVLEDMSNYVSSHDVKRGREASTGDIMLEDVKSPVQSGHALKAVKERYKKTHAELKAVTQEIKRASKKIRRLTEFNRRLSERNRRLIEKNRQLGDLLHLLKETSKVTYKSICELDDDDVDVGMSDLDVDAGMNDSDVDGGINDSDYECSEEENNSPAVPCNMGSLLV